MNRLRALGVDGSPGGGGRTRSAVAAVLAGLDHAADSEIVSLAEPGAPARVVPALATADALVVGSPVYRASYARPLKELLDATPRGLYGETGCPLRAKPVVIVATGASLHHFLALDDVRNVLAGFFACHVVPPGLYVPADGFTENGSLANPYAGQARSQAAALLELTELLASAEHLREVAPQA